MKSDDLISRQAAIDALDKRFDSIPMEQTTEILQLRKDLREMPSAQPETHDKRTEKHACDLIDRQMAIDGFYEMASDMDYLCTVSDYVSFLESLPSAQPEQRYTEEELRVFAHGISLSLLSKRSAQHWRYDKDTATEIEFLERLYEKVVADMGGEHDGKNT